jgi:hypothetical protein
MHASIPAGHDFDLLPGAGTINPRVFVRYPDEEFAEIAGIRSFERSDASESGGTISFAMSSQQSRAVNDILHGDPDLDVEVKMEFMFGMLMIMSFSGFVDSISSEWVSFTLSSVMTTNVVDVAH